MTGVIKTLLGVDVPGILNKVYQHLSTLPVERTEHGFEHRKMKLVDLAAGIGLQPALLRRILRDHYVRETIINPFAQKKRKTSVIVFRAKDAKRYAFYSIDAKTNPDQEVVLHELQTEV